MEKRDQEKGLESDVEGSSVGIVEVVTKNVGSDA